ncbi:hypothetical protein ACRAWF_27130 [Streptomyces sp. L7]
MKKHHRHPSHEVSTMTPPSSGPPMVEVAVTLLEVAAVATALAGRDHRRQGYLDEGLHASDADALQGL